MAKAGRNNHDEFDIKKNKERTRTSCKM